MAFGIRLKLGQAAATLLWALEGKVADQDHGGEKLFELVVQSNEGDDGHNLQETHYLRIRPKIKGKRHVLTWPAVMDVELRLAMFQQMAEFQDAHESQKEMQMQNIFPFMKEWTRGHARVDREHKFPLRRCEGF